jgi:serine/threonine protein kinase
MQRVPPLLTDTLIADYVVRSVVGHGGFGTTYLCEDKNLKKLFVVKELTPHHLVQRLENGNLTARGLLYRQLFDRMRDEYVKEAQALARFSHPNIARAIRYFETNNTAYLVMEYEAGQNLRAYLKARDGALTDHELEAIARPLCTGLDKLHAAGLIHRDLKPDNVLIRPDGSPVLLDFGAVIPFGDASEVVFTPGYAPPEQLLSRYGSQGAWTDIYALGATLYEMIEGKPPADARWRVAQTDPPSSYPRSGVGRHATKLLGLVEQCLALNIQERPQSMKDVLHVLKSDDDALLGAILKDTSFKMVAHFLNWATPNEGLYLDEFAAFAVAFPVIDLSWRIGEGIPDKTVFLRLLGASRFGADAVERCAAMLLERGFTSTRAGANNNLCLARMPDYAAAYLLDRQAENWTYDLLRKQLARHTLAPAASAADKEPFGQLMEDVIDRARFRVKREYGKQTATVLWYLKEDGTGWEKRVRSATRGDAVSAD